LKYVPNISNADYSIDPRMIMIDSRRRRRNNIWASFIAKTK